MAEIAVTTVLKALSSVAIPFTTFLGRQVSQVMEVHNQLDAIKKDLESIQSLLKFVDRRELGDDDLIKDWVKKVRDVAYDLEDILDNHMYGTSDRGERIECIVKEYWYELRLLFSYWQTANELQRIKPIVGEIMSIYNSVIRDRFSLLLHEDPASTASRDISISIMFNKDNVIFPMDESGITQKMIVERWIEEKPTEFLIEETNFDKKSITIALWGMGGLGKTTLARNIYDIQRPQFECCAWITVSKTYKVVDLLRKMIKELQGTEVEASLNELELIKMIHEALRQKKFFIVFDDVWQDNFWRKIENIFHVDYDYSSRILITTRHENVALSIAIKDRCLLLEPLNDEDSWSLFCRKVFHSSARCPPDLEYWGRKIVRKCGGLPLAIEVVGGMMSGKHGDGSTWERCYKTLSSDIGANTELSILMHSYHDLDPCLQQCFLFCSLFPEDYWFSCDELKSCWIVEGFVEKKDSSMTLEEAAKGYLAELIQRSLLHIGDWPDYSEEPSRCRIHDVLRELALKISAKQKFSTRRLLFHKEEKKISSNIDLSLLRSLYLSGMRYLAPIDFPYSRLKLLKVLHLSCHPILKLPDEVFDLFNLRVLKLIRTGIVVLPENIKKLQRLEELDLTGSNINMLPHNIVKLHNLRVLLIGFNSLSIPKVPARKWKLESLEILEVINASDELVEHLGELRHLIKLSIDKVNNRHWRLLCDSLNKMQRLRSLHITTEDYEATSQQRIDEVINLEEVISLEDVNMPPPHLNYLHLNGVLPGIPAWFQNLKELKTLILLGSKVEEGDRPLYHLESLPCLTVLELLDAYGGTKLCFPANCFPALRTLHIYSNVLETIEVERGALPNLHKLRIACSSLKEPTPQVGLLEKLERLILLNLSANMSEAFKRMFDDYERRVIATKTGDPHGNDLRIFMQQRILTETEWETIEVG